MCSELFEEIGANPNNGLGAVLEAIDNKLPAAKAKEIRDEIDACYEDRPWLAMVNSDKGITNLVRVLSRYSRKRNPTNTREDLPILNLFSLQML